MRRESDGRMQVPDMHAHLACFAEEYSVGLSDTEKAAMAEEELALRRQGGIVTFFSSGTPEEWEQMKKYLGESRDMLLSFGIHPWYSDRYCPDDYRRYLQMSDAVGEIGMDSVWCDVPLSVQRRVFVRQLELAAGFRKPVILHTKGQEREIAELLRGYPGKVCVHWYSGDQDSLEDFIEMGCYFTLGPDLASSLESGKEPAADLYRKMLQEIPADRLFVETDGISAVAWALETERLELKEIPRVLKGSLDAAAEAKQMSLSELRGRMYQNLKDFIL
ncbi:MAG: TatD family hydrolase [Lachnospiraceae bacterium]|nr:TatD family hydrolase [Lachnospiraceae bacterium]